MAKNIKQRASILSLFWVTFLKILGCARPIKPKWIYESTVKLHKFLIRNKLISYCSKEGMILTN